MRYNHLVKPDTFLGRYLEHMKAQETAAEYDFWCGMWLLSLAVGRQCVVDRPRAPVYLNLYCILVADSGITRKSSAVGVATRIAQKFCHSMGDPLLLTARETPEGLLDVLYHRSSKVGNAHVAISISELVTFMGREGYMRAMPGLLTDLYDCPHIQTTPGKDKRLEKSIRDVSINFLSASTPAWLIRAINPDVIEGGFTSRVLFIVGNRPKSCIPWPKEESDEPDFLGYLRDVNERATSIARIGITGKALDKFSSWYKSRTRNRDPYRASFESREDAHILRVAGLLAVNDGCWEIQNPHILSAIKIIEDVKNTGARIFENTGGDNKLAIALDKLRILLLSAGKMGIKHRELYLKVRDHLSNENFRYAMEIMHELDMIQVFEPVGQKYKLYRATNLITSQDSFAEMVGRLGQDGG